MPCMRVIKSRSLEPSNRIASAIALTHKVTNFRAVLASWGWLNKLQARNIFDLLPADGVSNGALRRAGDKAIAGFWVQ